MPLQLSVVTPDAEVLSTTCTQVTVPGVSGEMGLMPGHVALVTALRPGVLIVQEDRKQTFFAIGSGFAEIENDKVSVLTEVCEEVSQIDAVRAQRTLEDANDKLKTLGESDGNYNEQMLRLKRAQARIDTIERAKTRNLA